MEIDSLSCLKDMWGDSILLNRSLIYKVVSGNYDTEEQYRNIILSLCAKHPSFANYVDNAVIFGDKNIPLITRLIKPARAAIDEYTTSTCKLAENNGGRIIMYTHDYIYVLYKHSNIPEFPIATIIK